jgi:hypothetical protein
MHMIRTACVLFALSVAVQAQSSAPAGEAPPLECRDYASKLESCSPYTCTFTHPMTGGKLERRILGLTGTRCTTVEAMPGKHTMQCEYPADVRKAVASFYRDTQAADGAGKTIGGTLTVDASGTGRATTTVDGKPVVNPLQQAMASGICKIGG